MADAKQKRNEQLKRWIGSETDQEPPVVKRKKTKVKFDDSAVFLAACSSGDTEEVLRLLERGADINYANVDGFAALHQVCVSFSQFSGQGFRSFCWGGGGSAARDEIEACFFLPPRIVWLGCCFRNFLPLGALRRAVALRRRNLPSSPPLLLPTFSGELARL